MQLSFSLTRDPCPPRIGQIWDINGTGITVKSFGNGFSWHNRCYQNFADSVQALLPIAETHGIPCGVVPDFRGFNAQVCNTTKEGLLRLHSSPALFKTTRALDGVIVASGMSVFAISADCPIVILAFKQHMVAAVLHCGRDALAAGVQKNDSVINTACRMVAPFRGEEVVAFICNGIGPRSFEHTAPKDQSTVAHFAATCGAHVIKNMELGCLDLPRIIEHQLGVWGIENVSWDGVDTYRDNRFYSRRRGSQYNNCALVDMSRAFI